MNVLLLRPIPANERFGLGPFFRIEPLGMEYVAAALESRGHRVRIVDLRFSRPVEHQLRTFQPVLVGVACMHALETDNALEIVRRVKRARPETFTLVGGHAASAYPSPFSVPEVDAICLDDGERVVPELVERLEKRGELEGVGGLILPDGEGAFRPTEPEGESFNLDRVPLPARSQVEAFRRQYACLQYRPVWLVETARGCPFRCSFCSVWPLYRRSVRERSIDSVCRDLAAVGPNVFVADDLFWYHPERSRALAQELARRGIRKNWMLVQSRVDLVANHPELLEVWRPLARHFDIFFGLEAATNEGLQELVKDTTVDRTVEAIGVARQLGYMVTGNFVIDPAWEEADFERLWGFVEKHRLSRAGYTVLTPLPGTPFFEESKGKIRARDWSQFDMHHVLWEPRLGARRFFELYSETWRRSVLNLRGEKSFWRWAPQTRPRDFWFLARMLWRTQRLMDPAAYLAEHRLAPTPQEAAIAEPARSAPAARA
jgi:radical SAM superfamily enzyme YgiQ (UPF0313 family)